MIEVYLEDVDFGIIKIVSVPKGEAPEEIRQKWVDVEMPCMCFYANASFGGIITGTYQGSIAAYAVLQSHALAALREKAPEAADWWKTRGLPSNETDTFLFDAECVEVLKKPLTMEEIAGLAGLN